MICWPNTPAAWSPCAGAEPRGDLRRLRDCFGPGRLYVELQRHLDDAQAHHNRRAVAAAESPGIPAVATNDVRYAERRLRRAHDLLTCARLKTTVDAAGRQLLRNGERFLKPPAVMAPLFRDRPDALRATRVIAERCQLHPGRPRLSVPRLSRSDRARASRASSRPPPGWGRASASAR